MTTQYDLHTHSTASDGTLSPTELVQSAAHAGIDVIALTDHDTLAGVAEAKTAANEMDLMLIPGVEISVAWGGRTVHIVGLGVDTNAQPLQKGLARLREFRVQRAKQIAQGLVEAGVDESVYARACALASKSLISRTHFARALIELGHANSISAVFKKFLAQGKPGCVEERWATLKEAVGWIVDAGGQAVIAHPARYAFQRAKLHQFIREFIEVGGHAIEVVSGSHSRDDAFTIAQCAHDFGLLASAGSDYHGSDNFGTKLGPLPALPQGCQPIWHNWVSAG